MILSLNPLMLLPLNLLTKILSPYMNLNLTQHLNLPTKNLSPYMNLNQSQHLNQVTLPTRNLSQYMNLNQSQHLFMSLPLLTEVILI